MSLKITDHNEGKLTVHIHTDCLRQAALLQFHIAAWSLHSQKRSLIYIHHTFAAATWFTTHQRAGVYNLRCYFIHNDGPG